MSTILFYDSSAVVSNQATNIVYSVNTPDYNGVANKVINPDLSSVLSLPMKFWKVDGTSVVGMSSGEQNTVDASLLPGIKADEKARLATTLTQFFASRGYDIDTRSNLQAMYTDGVRLKPNKGKYVQSMIDWLHSADTELTTKQALIDAQTTIANAQAVTIDTATLASTDPLVTLTGAIAEADSTSLDSFIDSNAEVTDVTGIKGPYYLMEILNHRRNLYNDSTNPIYIPGFVPILGDSGILVDHANRILNVETIHGKLGWHEQMVLKSLYYAPKDLLIYYSWINSFNSAQNGWDNEKVALDMARYRMIILGDGIEDPSHGDYANTQIVIPRVKDLSPDTLIFGYVAVAQSYANFQTKVSQWNTLGVHGIFMDEAGYDFGKTRAEFNTCVDYVHGKTNAKFCFANSWNTDHVLGTANDVSYPNSTYNSGAVESHLNTLDWILLESFPINTTAYAGGYESQIDWQFRGQKAVNLRAVYGVNFCGAGIINNDNTNGLGLFKFGYVSALMFALEGYGTSDTNYAASSAAVNFWNRPTITGLNSWALYPSVRYGTDNTNVYHRYTDSAHLTLNFGTHASNTNIQGAITGGTLGSDKTAVGTVSLTIDGTSYNLLRAV